MVLPVHISSDNIYTKLLYLFLAFSGPPAGIGVQGDTGVQSYEISPFRDSSDEDSEDEQERSQKPIPQWARYC